IDKNLADAYWQRGELAYKKGNVSEALTDLETALKKRPSRYEAYATMALCYMDQTELDKAEAAWQKAIEGNDQMPEWHYRLGKILKDRGKKEDALPHFLMAVELINQAIEDKKTGSPPWLAQADYELGEALRFKDKPRALKA